ncbi:MAG: flavin prenyltransferase UbiX [Nitrospirota bacterium]
MKSYAVAISGASGAVYGIRLLEYLSKEGYKVYLTASSDGLSIIRNEVGIDWLGDETEVNKDIKERFGGDIRYFEESNLNAPIASGSVYLDGMIVIPCSMKAMSAIAHGFSSNLIERAADVTIKERRRLVIVPRETPLSAIHLRNMLTLAETGVHIIPAMPAFYHNPKSIDHMVDFIVGRVLDSLGIQNNIFARWGKGP